MQKLVKTLTGTRRSMSRTSTGKVVPVDADHVAEVARLRSLARRDSDAIARKKTRQQNKHLLQRFDMTELERGMLVEFMEDVHKPEKWKLCKIFLINDKDPVTYDLRWCSEEPLVSDSDSRLRHADDLDRSFIFRDIPQMQIVDGFVKGKFRENIKRVRIKRYHKFVTGNQVQVLVNSNGTAHTATASTSMDWFNAKVLESSPDETMGVVYKVNLLRAGPSSKKPSSKHAHPFTIPYERIRKMPHARHKIHDCVEVICGERQVYPGVIKNVLLQTAVAGGIEYEVKYHEGGDTKASSTLGFFAQQKVRRCFTERSLAEYYHHRSDTAQTKGKAKVLFGDGWVKCSVSKVRGYLTTCSIVYSVRYGLFTDWKGFGKVEFKRVTEPLHFQYALTTRLDQTERMRSLSLTVRDNLCTPSQKTYESTFVCK